MEEYDVCAFYLMAIHSWTYVCHVGGRYYGWKEGRYWEGDAGRETLGGRYWGHWEEDTGIETLGWGPEKEDTMARRQPPEGARGLADRLQGQADRGPAFQNNTAESQWRFSDFLYRLGTITFLPITLV